MERRQFLQSTGLGAAATMLGVAPLTAATTHLSFLKETASNRYAGGSPVLAHRVVRAI